MLEEKVFEDLKYLIRNGEKKNSPVIILLHGAGTRGDDYDLIRNNPATVKLEKYSDLVYIIPQCHKNSWFDHFETLHMIRKYTDSKELKNILSFI